MVRGLSAREDFYGCCNKEDRGKKQSKHRKRGEGESFSGSKIPCMGTGERNRLLSLGKPSRHPGLLEKRGLLKGINRKRKNQKKINPRNAKRPPVLKKKGHVVQKVK